MSEITMYGAEWCTDCRRSKKFLDSNNVKYNYIDVEADRARGGGGRGGGRR